MEPLNGTKGFRPGSLPIHRGPAGGFLTSLPEQPIESFSIITTSDNQLMRSIHDRMPAILEPELFKAWLDTRAEPEFLKSIVQPYEWNGFETLPVSAVVNNERNETPECVVPVSFGTDPHLHG